MFFVLPSSYADVQPPDYDLSFRPPSTQHVNAVELIIHKNDFVLNENNEFVLQQLKRKGKHWNYRLRGKIDT